MVRDETLKRLADPLANTEDSRVHIFIQNDLQLLYSTSDAQENEPWIAELRKKSWASTSMPKA
jgi:hypothetical protein